MKIALQLYTLKEHTREDMFGVLEKVAAAGFDGVEFAGYMGIEACAMKAKLDELGLCAISSHVGIQALEENFDAELAYCKTLGIKYMICPYAKPETMEQCLTLAQKLSAWGEIAAKSGIKLGYHNHAFEFMKIDGEYALDIIFKHADPIHVVCEFDTYWIYKGGENPVDYIGKYSGRCPLVHAKDIAKDGEGDTEAGSGLIDFVSVVKAGGNVEWLIAEQERFDKDQFESIQISCDNLKRLF